MVRGLNNVNGAGIVKSMHRVAVFAALALATHATQAALVVDEATFPGAGGDYNNLLSPPRAEALVFTLEGGTNTFAGTFGTPGDGGDTMALLIAPLNVLTGIRVTFATNATEFNPVAINQGTKLVFDLASSDQPTPLVTIGIGGRPDGAVLFSSGVLAIDAGLYTSTLLTEVLALNNNNGRVGYSIAFDVTAPTPDPIPEPSTYALLLSGLGLLGWAARRRATPLKSA
jgi:hypothetical protein